MWLALLRCLLSWGGLELNPQYLWGLPVHIWESYELFNVSKCSWAATWGCCEYCSNPARSWVPFAPTNRSVKSGKGNRCFREWYLVLWESMAWALGERFDEFVTSLTEMFLLLSSSCDLWLCPSGVCSSVVLCFYDVEQEMLQSIFWGLSGSCECGCCVRGFVVLGPSDGRGVCVHVLIVGGVQGGVPPYLRLRDLLQWVRSGGVGLEPSCLTLLHLLTITPHTSPLDCFQLTITLG